MSAEDGGAEPPLKPECADALDSIYAYLDSELGVAAAVRVRAHLHECSPCLDEYDIEQVIKAVVRRSCAETAPAELRIRIMARIEQLRIVTR